MRVFVTGATGFIGSAIVKELIAAGHRVVGLARSEDGANALQAAGAQVQRGDVNDLENLRKGAAASDGVIHTAFNHDFSKFLANCEDDRRVIEALGAALAGSNRPLIVTSGTAIAGAPGKLSAENDTPLSSKQHPRAASEEAAAAVAAKGGHVVVVRLPQVHDTRKQGLVTYAIDLARQKRAAAYIGDGSGRWPAAHILDTARLYRLALEKGKAGAKYHAVAEEGVPVRQMTEVFGRGLNLPVISLSPAQAQGHFGWLAMFAALDMPSSSALTRKELGWNPAGPGIIADLENMDYSQLRAQPVEAHR